jgi:amino acid permease
MADNDSKEALLHNEDGEHKKKGPDEIIPFLLLLVTASGMGVSGVGWALYIFNIKSFTWGFFLLLVFSITYYFNHIIIVNACYESGQYSFSKLIKHHWGRKRGLTVQIAMAIHCIIVITYLQQRISVNAYKVFHSDVGIFPSYTDTFYYVAIANIPLILLALQNKYERIRWFAIIGILVWVYLFIGVFTEASASDISFFSDAGQLFPEPGIWMLTSVGLLGYFMSSFQIIPYLCQEVKCKDTMKRVVFKSSIGSLIIIATVIMYFGLKTNADLNSVRFTGFVIIGACVTIINVLPTRELIVQILEEKAKDKQNTRDRFITLCVLSLTLILSIFINNVETWQVFVGLGAILTALLGFVFPGVLFFKIAEKDEEKKKYIVLVWNVILGLVVFVAGVFMMIVERNTEEIKQQ